MPRIPVLIGLSLVALAGASALRGEMRPREAKAPAFVIDSIASPAAPGSAEPNLTAAPDGRVYMTWIEPADSASALRFAVLTGRQWTAPRTIRAGRDFFINWADFPSIQVLGGGRLAAHWLQRNGTGTYAYGVRIVRSMDDGRTWGAPIMPHRDSSQTEHGFVAMWPEKGAVGAVWLDARKSGKPGHDHANEMMLMSTTIDARGRLGPEVPLDQRTCDCCQNSAAMTSAGPIVAYRDRSPEEIRDIHVTRRVNGRWVAGAPVHADNWKINACPVNGPSIAADGRRVVIAWFTAPGDSARVNVAFSDDAGARFSPPVRIDGGAPAGRVDVALLPAGDALVTWIERIGGDTAAVRVRRVARNGTLGAPMTVARSSAARASGFPQMVLTGSDVVFAWTVPGRPSAIRVARSTIAGIR